MCNQQENEDLLGSFWREHMKGVLGLVLVALVFTVFVSIVKDVPALAAVAFIGIGVIGATFFFLIFGLPFHWINRKIWRRALAYRETDVPTPEHLQHKKPSKARIWAGVMILLLWGGAALLDYLDEQRNFYISFPLTGLLILFALTILYRLRCEACKLPFMHAPQDPDRPRFLKMFTHYFRFATARQCPRCALRRH